MIAPMLDTCTKEIPRFNDSGERSKLTSPNPARRLHLLLVFPFALLSMSLGVVEGQHKSVFPSLLGEEIERRLESQILSCHMFHVIMMHV
jgi:hypothetical protein